MRHFTNKRLLLDQPAELCPTSVRTGTWQPLMLMVIGPPINRRLTVLLFYRAFVSDLAVMWVKRGLRIGVFDLTATEGVVVRLGLQSVRGLTV